MPGHGLIDPRPMAGGPFGLVTPASASSAVAPAAIDTVNLLTQLTTYSGPWVYKDATNPATASGDAVDHWTAASGQSTTLTSGTVLYRPNGLATGQATVEFADASTMYLGAMALASKNLTFQAVVLVPAGSGATTILGPNPGSPNSVPTFRLVNSARNVDLVDSNVADPGVSTGGISTGAAHHVAATYDGTTVRYYIDGQPAGSAAYSGFGSFANPLWLGGDHNASYFGANGAAQLAELDAWNKVLSPAAILADYTSRLKIQFPALP